MKKNQWMLATDLGFTILSVPTASASIQPSCAVMQCVDTI